MKITQLDRKEMLFKEKFEKYIALKGKLNKYIY